jgi:hypothetical protein
MDINTLRGAVMSDLNILLRRMNQRTSAQEAVHMEDAAVTLLAGLLVLITVASLL